MKVAIVSGASRGIGAEIAQRLANDGYSVVIGYNNSKEKAQEIVHSVIEKGGNAKAYRLEMTDDNLSIVVEEIHKQFGRIDLLINNAGIADQKLFTEISSDEWNQMIDINLSGAFKLTKAVLPYMVHEKRGKIINIASIWGECGGSCEVHYSAAKAGLIGMTKALAKELAPSGITVNSISPGVILTDMTTHFDESTMQSLKEEIPLGRIGSPKDIAGVVSFLASDDADYITGQDIPVNGGMYI